MNLRMLVGRQQCQLQLGLPEEHRRARKGVELKALSYGLSVRRR
jgi:hypothetical protein